MNPAHHSAHDHERGTLLLIGGAEDKVGGRTILNRFVRLAGGHSARIAVIATASAYYDWVGQRYMSLFHSLGAARVEVVKLRDRVEAMQPEALRQLDAASGIFVTGGDQLKLTATMGGTPVARKIRERHRAGAVFAGTSAGASVASEHMMAYGVSGAPPRRAMMQFAPGLGLISGVVVDQHFGARGRTGRLMTAVAHNPDLLGVGLDEDTAVEIRPDGVLSVLGRGSVMIVDGSHMTHTDIHHIPDHSPLTVFGMLVHVLSNGYLYDIAARAPHQPNEPPVFEQETEGLSGEGI